MKHWSVASRPLSPSSVMKSHVCLRYSHHDDNHFINTSLNAVLTGRTRWQRSLRYSIYNKFRHFSLPPRARRECSGRPADGPLRKSHDILRMTEAAAENWEPYEKFSDSKFRFYATSPLTFFSSSPGDWPSLIMARSRSTSPSNISTYSYYARSFSLQHAWPSPCHPLIIFAKIPTRSRFHLI